MTTPDETSRWEPVKDLMAGAAPVSFGPMHTYQWRHSPRRLLFTTSYYKFAAKMIGGPSKRVLDIGCGEGLGTWLLAKECGYARGVDFDEDSINTAKANWADDSIDFFCGDVLKQPAKDYDAVVNFDVIEHIMPEHADAFVQGMVDNLGPYGIGIIGTPNITTRQYASAVTNAGHVNMYDGERLKETMGRFFTQVFMFGANDEVVHTGFLPMCHYLIAMGVRPRR
jgi:2-polyprenyl-3-methyl-5-hydroxy-6-metoxy-1,4-benzoquinol methylase